MEASKYITAYYEDDSDLLTGLKQIKEKGIQIIDVLTPFPVHGIDSVLGYRRSWIARVGFIGGAFGALTGFLFQAWVFTSAYPLNIGGKPFFAVPSFIPVTFELTVLFAAVAMVFGFLIRSKLGPGAPHISHDERSTDDRFLVIIDASDAVNDADVEKISSELSQAGALGITLKNN